MLHTEFRENQPAGFREEKKLRVFTIYGHGGHLGHVISIITLNFHLHVPKAYIQNLVKITQWFLSKASFNFHM